MSESELAFNQWGEPFAVPEGVTGWRVRRLKGTRGQPELVYGPDGPVVLDVHATLEDLRDAVGAGRYRLDPIDDHGKQVPEAPIAYAQVVIATTDKVVETASEAKGIAVEMTSVDLALREMARAATELARTNSELAKSIVSKQPDVMLATAEILRAADGAGLPAREPFADDGDEADGGQELAVEGGKRLDVVALLEMIIPVALPPLMERIPGLRELLDPRKAAAAGAAAREKKRAVNAAQTDHSKAAPTSAASIHDESAVEAKPTSGASGFAHIMAIQAALDPDESAFAQAAAASMDARERAAWFAELSTLSVADGVTRIRTEIANAKAKEGAS